MATRRAIWAKQKRADFVLLAVAAFSGVAILAIISPTMRDGNKSPNGRSKAGTEVYEFGSHEAGTALTHVFRLKNPEQHPIQIERVIPSCTCTAVDSSQKSVPAGSHVDIPVQVRLPDREGRFSTTIKVVFAGAAPVDLTVCGTLLRPAPNRVDLGDVKRGDESWKTFALRSRDGGPATVAKLLFDADIIDAIVERGEKETRLKIRPNRAAPYGAFQSTVQLTIEGQPEKAITVAGRVLPLVYAVVSDLALGELQPGQALPAAIQLRAPYGNRFNVVSAISSPAELAFVDIKAATLVNGDIVVPIVVCASATGRLMKGSVDLECIDESGVHNRVRVGLYGLVRSR